jgi:hypothetical protein
VEDVLEAARGVLEDHLAWDPSAPRSGRSGDHQRSGRDLTVLQGILKSKLSPALREGAFEVEDFLTSIALGACEYVAPELALIPFPETARDRDLKPLQLAHLDVRSVTYQFWSYRGAVVRDGAPVAAGGEPELLLHLETPLGAWWLLVEVKLGSEKSSVELEGPVVTDQLAKYWLHLREIAGERALGVVYVTKHAAMPDADLQASELELAKKSASAPRLYWTHWRELTRIAQASAESVPLLRDLATVLEGWFGLAAVVTEWRWPEPPASCDVWSEFRWSWPERPEVLAGWTFAWSWPDSPREGAEWRWR